MRTSKKTRTYKICMLLPSRFTGRHFPIMIGTTSPGEAQKRRVVCLSQKKRREEQFVSVIYNCKVVLYIDQTLSYWTKQLVYTHTIIIHVRNNIFEIFSFSHNFLLYFFVSIFYYKALNCLDVGRINYWNTKFFLLFFENFLLKYNERKIADKSDYYSFFLLMEMG